MGASAANISWNDSDQQTASNCFHYFNGGGTFLINDQGSNAPNCRKLATYSDLPGTPASVVHCEAGQGVAVVSGIHIEYNPHNMDETEQYLKPIVPKLKSTYNEQEKHFRSILKDRLRLDIQ